MTLHYDDANAARTQIVVYSNDVQVALIGKESSSATAGRTPTWRWYFLLGKGPPGFQSVGDAISFKEAQAHVERNWALWCDAIGETVPLAPDDCPPHGNDQPIPV
jgi:hypothetical protein